MLSWKALAAAMVAASVLTAVPAQARAPFVKAETTIVLDHELTKRGGTIKGTARPTLCTPSQPVIENRKTPKLEGKAEWSRIVCKPDVMAEKHGERVDGAHLRSDKKPTRMDRPSRRDSQSLSGSHMSERVKSRPVAKVIKPLAKSTSVSERC